MIKVQQERQQLNQFENEILELIDNQNDITRSDIQGLVSVIVFNIYNQGINDSNTQL